MNGKVTDEAVVAALIAIASGHVSKNQVRAGLEAALPHLQPAKPEAVRLRDELRERAALESAAREVVTLIRSIPESELLALDADKHPPSSLSEAATTLQAAIAVTGKQQVGEVQGDARAALESAMPYLETLHSIVGGEARASVWRCIERGRLALAAPPAQGIDLGQFIALAKFGEEFAFSAEKQPHSRVVYSQASRLLALIEGQAEVSNGAA